MRYPIIKVDKETWDKITKALQSDNTLIAVKGMKMPKDCPACPLSHWANNWTFLGCNIGGHRYAMKDKKYAESNTRPDWCPLVEVEQEQSDET